MGTNIYILVQNLNCYLNINSFNSFNIFIWFGQAKSRIRECIYNPRNDLFKEINCSVEEKILILTNKIKMMQRLMLLHLTLFGLQVFYF